MVLEICGHQHYELGLYGYNYHMQQIIVEVVDVDVALNVSGIVDVTIFVIIIMKTITMHT